MRPIDKGSCPQINGVDKVVTNYQDWRLDLISRIGAYCVYCNMPITHSLQVEHVVAKNPQNGQPQGSLNGWDNVLLACGPCNRAKSNKTSDENLHYLPEFHNTLIPFVCQSDPQTTESLIIEINNRLNQTQQSKSDATINLLELRRIDIRGNIVDLRWRERYNESTRVKAARELLDTIKQGQYDKDDVGKHIAQMAKGFFLLWFKEFENEPYVIKWLIHPSLFPGVAQNCFDAAEQYKQIGRNPNNPIDTI